MNSQIEQIKSLVKMSDVFRAYGFKMDNSKFTKCPFHNENTASLTAYKNDTFFHCFGCGEHGGVLDFVMKLFDINLKQAILRIDNDFRLNLTRQTYTISKNELQHKRIQQQQEAQAKEAELSELTECHMILHGIYLNHIPETENDINDIYGFAIYHMDILKCQIEQLQTR